MTHNHASAPAGCSTCCWSWFSPAARSAWSATPQAPPWPSPSTLTPASESCCLWRETSTWRKSIKSWMNENKSVSVPQCAQPRLPPHPAAPAAPAAPPSTCEDSRVRSAAGRRWRWPHRRPTARCFPGVEEREGRRRHSQRFHVRKKLIWPWISSCCSLKNYSETRRIIGAQRCLDSALSREFIGRRGGKRKKISV